MNQDSKNKYYALLRKNIISIFHSKCTRFTIYNNSNSCFRERGWGMKGILFKKEI